MQYFDKNGKEIKAGMKILMDDGSIEMVYDTDDQYRGFLKFYTSLEAKHDKEEREFVFEQKHIAIFLKIGRRPKR